MFYKINGKKNFYRWSTIFIIVIIVTLSSVLKVYEDEKIGYDDLNFLLPQKKLEFYIHFSDSDNNWFNFVLFDDLAKNFFPQFSNQLDIILQKNKIKQAGFVVLRENDKLLSGWIVVSKNQQNIILPSHWYVEEFSKVKLISNNQDFINIIKSQQTLRQDSLKKYFIRHGIVRGMSDYIYINLQEQKTFRNYINTNNYSLSWPAGNWLITHNNKRIKVLNLNKNIKINPFSFNLLKSLWLQVFLNKDVVGHNLDKDLLIKIFKNKELPLYIKNKLNLWENKYKIKILSLLEEIKSPMDVTIDYKQNKLNWVVRMEIDESGWKIINKIITTESNYAHPVTKNVILPDGSKAEEIIPGNEQIKYKTIELDNKQVNIISFVKGKYFIWSQDGKYKILSNNIDLIRKYLKKHPKTKISDCLKGVNSSLVIDFNSQQYKDIGLQNLIFTGLKNQSVFTICYK